MVERAPHPWSPGPQTAVCPDRICVRCIAGAVEALVASYPISPVLPRTRALIEALRDECAEALQAVQEEPR